MKFGSRVLVVEFFICTIWTAGYEAFNIDIIEPIVRRSPALDVDMQDGFGWAAIFHQTEKVLPNDSIDEALKKTR